MHECGLSVHLVESYSLCTGVMRFSLKKTLTFLLSIFLFYYFGRAIVNMSEYNWPRFIWKAEWWSGFDVAGDALLRERESLRERETTCWFTSHVITKARNEADQRQESGTPLSTPIGIVKVQVTIICCFPSTLARNWFICIIAHT